jgi:hypothetical protein
MDMNVFLYAGMLNLRMDFHEQQVQGRGAPHASGRHRHKVLAWKASRVHAAITAQLVLLPGG